MNREIHSKYKNAGLGYFIIGAMFFFNIGSLVFGKTYGRSPGISFLMILIYLLTIAFLILWQRANKITLDMEKQTIQYRNFFSQEPCMYSFKELDGFVTRIVRNKQGKAKEIALMKGRRRIKKLSGFTYSNIDELEAAIAQMTVRLNP